MLQKSYLPKPLPTTSTTTTSTTTTTTAKPTLSYFNVEQNIEDNDNVNLAKTLDSISLWHKLQAMNNAEGRQGWYLNGFCKKKEFFIFAAFV